MYPHTNHSIKFYASYSRQYGKNSALILAQLDYWHSKCSIETHPDGFYKFLKPCNHRDYRKGDSWLEELDMHPKAFYRAFKNIGVHYDSRTMFEEAFKKHGNNVFHGKPWLKIYDRYSNKTYFLKNFDHKKEALSADEPINQKKIRAIRTYKHQVHQQKVPYQAEVSYETTETLDSIAHGEFIQENINIVNKKFNKDLKKYTKILDKYSSEETTDITECPSGIGQNVLSAHYISENTPVLSHARTREKKIKKIDRTAENLQVAQEMVKAWNYATNDRIEPTNRQIAFLLQALKDKFEGSLNKWRDFCRRIGLSKFLMSKKSSWFCLDWVLIFRNMEKIILGKLGWDAPEIISSDYQEKLKINNDQLVADETNPKLREFKIKLRERLGEGNFNYLMKSSFHLEENEGEIIARVSYETGYSLSRSYDKQRAFGAVVDNLNITSFKIIGPGCSDPTHRYHDPNRVHFEYPSSRQVHKIKSLWELVTQNELLAQKNVGDLFQAAKNDLKAPILGSVSP